MTDLTLGGDRVSATRMDVIASRSTISAPSSRRAKILSLLPAARAHWAVRVRANHHYTICIVVNVARKLRVRLSLRDLDTTV